MSQPEASLVLMAYNQESFIKEAVLAAFAQEGPPIEIILSDDCSSDGTFSVMQQLAAEYRGPHKVILNRNAQNLGIVAHYGKAVSVSSGRWIVQADGDDISHPSRVVRLMQEAKMHPDAAAITSWFQVIYESGKIEASSAKHHRQMQAMQSWPLLDLLSSSRRGYGSYTLLGAATAWRRDLFEKFPPFGDDKDLYEDVILRWRALLLGRSYIIDDVLISYRRHEGSITNWSGLVDPVEAERREVNLLKRALKCLKYSRGDFSYACKAGIISEEALVSYHAEIDMHIGYLEALLDWKGSSSSQRAVLLFRYWRFGIWKQVLNSLLKRLGCKPR